MLKRSYIQQCNLTFQSIENYKFETLLQIINQTSYHSLLSDSQNHYKTSMSDQPPKKANNFAFLLNNKDTPQKSQQQPSLSVNSNFSFFGSQTSAQGQQSNSLGFMAGSGNLFNNKPSLFQNPSSLFNKSKQQKPKFGQQSNQQQKPVIGLFAGINDKNDSIFGNQSKNKAVSLFGLAPNKQSKKADIDSNIFTSNASSLFGASDQFTKKPTFDVGITKSLDTATPIFNNQGTKASVESTFNLMSNASKSKEPVINFKQSNEKTFFAHNNDAQKNQKPSPISQQHNPSRMQTEKKSITPKGMSVEDSKTPKGEMSFEKSRQKSELKQDTKKDISQTNLGIKDNQSLFGNSSSIFKIDKNQSGNLFKNEKTQGLFGSKKPQGQPFTLFQKSSTENANQKTDRRQNDSPSFGIPRLNEEDKNANTGALKSTKSIGGQIFYKGMLPSVITQHANQQQSGQLQLEKQMEISPVKGREPFNNKTRQQEPDMITFPRSRQNKPNKNTMRMSTQNTQRRGSVLNRMANRISTEQNDELKQTRMLREHRQRDERSSTAEIGVQSQNSKLEIKQFIELQFLDSTQESWLYICRHHIKSLSIFIINLFNLSSDFKNQSISQLYVLDSIDDVKLSSKQGVNKVYNDLLKFIIKNYSLAKNPPAVSTFADIFLYMVNRIKLQQKILTQSEDLNDYYLKQFIYSAQGQQKIINEYSAQVGNICRIFGSCLEKFRMIALKILTKFPKLYHRPYNIFEHNLRFFVIKQCFDQNTSRQRIMLNDELKEAGTKSLEACYSSLSKYAEKFGDDYAKISKEVVCEILAFLNDVKGSQTIKKILKMVLVPMKMNNNLWDNQQISTLLKKSNSLQLLPLKFVILKKVNNSVETQNFLPQSKDLFSFVEGSQWIDWLEFYIQGPNRYIQTSQKQLLIDAIATFDENSGQRVFNNRSGLFNLIMQLKRQDQLVNFFTVLQALCWSRDSIRKVEQSFFKNRQELRYYLQGPVKSIIDLEVRQEELEVNKAKIRFILKIIQVSPEMIYLYESLLLNPLSDKPDEDNLSSHRFCHFLIDMIKYYSYNGDSEILASVFNSITTLLKYKDTNITMTLAMKVDRPQFAFYNLNLSHSLIEALNQQLVLLLESPQFYNSFNSVNNDAYLTSASMMNLRYTEQYMEAMAPDDLLLHMFPTYWLSNLMKIVPKQKYNPQVLNKLAQKLLILPYPQINNEGIVQAPFMIKCIVQVLNLTRFEQQLIDHIEVGWRNSQTRSFNLCNKKLQQNYDLHQKNVFYTLKLIVTLLKLKHHVLQYVSKYPNHCITVTIQNLDCIDKIFDKLSYQPHLYDSEHYKINPITALATHLNYNDSMKNLSDIQKTEWNSVSISADYAQRFLEQHDQELRIIDHRLIRNFFAHQPNIYMESIESMQYLVLESLRLLISLCSTRIQEQGSGSKTPTHFQLRPIVLSQALYAMPCSQNQFYQASDQRNRCVKSNFKMRLLNILDPQGMNQTGKISARILKQRGLRLVEQLMKSGVNRSLARQIMEEFWARRPARDGDIRINRCLVSIIKEDMQTDGQWDKQHSEKLQDIIRAVVAEQSEFERPLWVTIEEYRSKKFPISTYHQFEKILVERRIASSVDFYFWIEQVIYILLARLYNKTYGIEKLISLFVTFIVKNRIIAITGRKIDEMNYFDSIRQQLPRKYNRDPLEYHISKKHSIQHLEIAHQIQCANVETWAMNASYRLNQNLNKFLTVLISIDQTYFANLPITFAKTASHSQIFCSSHLGTVPYLGQALMGKNPVEAIENVKTIGQLMTLSLKPNYKSWGQQIFDQPDETKMRESSLKTVIHIMGACVDWLFCRKSQPAAQRAAALLTNLIFQMKNFWMKSVITCQVTGRLLMTIIMVRGSISENQDSRKYISECIYDSIFQKNVENPYLNQQILSILNVLTPRFEQNFRIEMLVNLWCRETSNQFFYNQSRVLVQIVTKYPLLIAKLRPFQRCEKLKQVALANPTLRYSDSQRNADQIVWNWALIILKTLCNSCQESSTVIAELVNEFMRTYKIRLLSTLSEMNTTAVFGDKSNFVITYAFLEELDETLQVLALVMNMDLWANMNREYLQEIVYVLTHKTICLFTNQQFAKINFIPFSQNEKKLSQIKYTNLERATGGFSLQTSLSLSQRQSEDSKQSHFQSLFSIFNIAMQIKYFSVLRSWELATSFGISQSWYVEKYFEQSIVKTQITSEKTDRNIYNYRYSVTYWDRMNKSLMDITRKVYNSLQKLLTLENLDKSLALMADCYRASETFIENGYLNGLLTLPSNKNQLWHEFRVHSVLLMELTMTHFMHEISYKEKYGTLMRNHLQGFQKRIIFNCKELQQKFMRLDEQAGPFDSNYFRNFRESIQYIQIR